MDIQKEFDLLSRDFDLKEADFYFLNLIPLIEVIWADGQNQDSELTLLYKYTIEHIAKLDQATGSSVISVDDANDFLDRFAHQKPPAALLKRLRELAMHVFHKERVDDRQTIMDYCMDIAAACTTRYPYGLQERITDSEKSLLNELFLKFNIDSARTAKSSGKY